MKQPPNGRPSPCSASLYWGTLWITKWAAAKTKSAADFIPLAAVSPVSRTAWPLRRDYVGRPCSWVFPPPSIGLAYDGQIYSIGFLVGWPIITFLMAERLRNLGKFTFADVAGYRLPAGTDPAPLRHRARWWSWPST